MSALNIWNGVRQVSKNTRGGKTGAGRKHPKEPTKIALEKAAWVNGLIDSVAEPRGRGRVIEALLERLEMKGEKTLYPYLAGKQEFTTEQMSKIAEYFGRELPTKFYRGVPLMENHNNIVRLRPRREQESGWIPYRVLGVVEAGGFREADLMSQVEPREVSGPSNDVYPNAQRMAWEARGDSMNEEGIFDGTILFGVDFQAAGGVLMNEDIVVIQRNRSGLIERSVKEVAIYPDRTEFVPRSSNPLHKPIVYKNGTPDDDAEVKILSVIHGWITRPRGKRRM